MDFSEDSLKARYQVHKNVFVTCYLDIIEATVEGFTAQVGIRAMGDTVIPVGTKLYLTSAPIKAAKNLRDDEFEMFYVLIQGVEIDCGVPLQTCSPIYREIRENNRLLDRVETDFSLQMKEIGDLPFLVLNGSHGGLTLQYQASGMFMGLVPGNQYHLKLTHKDKVAIVPALATHIQYDWYNNQHLLGVHFLKLDDKQEFMLNRLLDPQFEVKINQRALVDTDEAKIRPD